jgi:hypothetical protein
MVTQKGPAGAHPATTPARIVALFGRWRSWRGRNLQGAASALSLPQEISKLKGVVTVRLPDGYVMLAEVHWYEAHGVGRKEFKIKRLLEPRSE